MSRPTMITPKILYIEGHTVLRDVFSQLLEYGGDYEISVAHHGIEGVAKAQTLHPDLILMGLRMPQMDGFETIKVLRSKPATADTPIIVLSAWADARSKQRALSAGANEHITPPVDIHWLLQRINSYLGPRHRSI